MSNFHFLTENPRYNLFAAAAVDAENLLELSPSMSAAASRKALELAVKWVYAADKTLSPPYRDNIQSLIHEPSFRFAVDRDTWQVLPYIIKLGNIAVHTEKQISRTDAVNSLSALFHFIQWIDCVYGETYTRRTFSEKDIPKGISPDILTTHTRTIRQKESEIETLQNQIRALAEEYETRKKENTKTRTIPRLDTSEFETRKKYIDVDLKYQGWEFGNNWRNEFDVDTMGGIEGQSGRADYVLFGKDGKPLAVVEAKNTCKDPNIGRQQCKLYADSLERKYGRRPVMFYTNGFETYFWDDKTAPPRQVSSIFSQEDLQRIIDRRENKKDLRTIPVDDKITNRYYQKEAIRAVCDNFQNGIRKSLLVMATGTGKTRTAVSLVDVLSRGGHILNVLFLADRTPLVDQAEEAFENNLKDISRCNLLKNKKDTSARIIFSTYPTILNTIDKIENGKSRFSPAHFDLIILDEAHRSIFKKYRAIFDYFDACLLGLTATPKDEIDRNTYDFFETEPDVPTFAYDYETAVYKDRYLVPYHNIEVKTQFLEEGIYYDDLSEEDKERFEEDFTEDFEGAEFIPSAALNRFIFNQNTVDIVLNDLMENGIKTAGGDRIGKTIIFAQNKIHAQFITERFDKLYPQYKGLLARRIVHEDNYAKTLITDFKQPEKNPHIAVSVDMMDTGVDVPEVVNLVFFKKVRSKTKFWQMIGRGTRLCPDLECIDGQNGEYRGKKYFYIFDYCGNFAFFREKQNGIQGHEVRTLTQSIFEKQLDLIQVLQTLDYADDAHQTLRQGFVDTILSQITALNTEKPTVRLKLKYIEKFKEPEIFVTLSEQDKSELKKHFGSLVYNAEPDEYAKRFDNLIYGYMYAKSQNSPAAKSYCKKLIDIAESLGKRITVPQIREKVPLIKAISTETKPEKYTLLYLDYIRENLRSLIQFLVDDGPQTQKIYTNLQDVVLDRMSGGEMPAAYNFENYKKKVNRYIEEHKDDFTIWKLRNNQKLCVEDYQILEDIFTQELGTLEDYKNEFGETPFGLLIRRIAKMDRGAALETFSDFINRHNLSQPQIVFVEKVIDYVVENGYLEPGDIMKPPFDKPQNFMKLFQGQEQREIYQLIVSIKDNALV